MASCCEAPGSSGISAACQLVLDSSHETVDIVTRQLLKRRTKKECCLAHQLQSRTSSKVQVTPATTRQSAEVTRKLLNRRRTGPARQLQRPLVPASQQRRWCSCNRTGQGRAHQPQGAATSLLQPTPLRVRLPSWFTWLYAQPCSHPPPPTTARMNHDMQAGSHGLACRLGVPRWTPAPQSASAPRSEPRPRWWKSTRRWPPGAAAWREWCPAQHSPGDTRVHMHAIQPARAARLFAESLPSSPRRAPPCACCPCRCRHWFPAALPCRRPPCWSGRAPGH